MIFKWIKVTVETQHPLRSPNSRNTEPTDEVGDQTRKNNISYTAERKYRFERNNDLKVMQPLLCSALIRPPQSQTNPHRPTTDRNIWPEQLWSWVFLTGGGGVGGDYSNQPMREWPLSLSLSGQNRPACNYNILMQ